MPRLAIVLAVGVALALPARAQVRPAEGHYPRDTETYPLVHGRTPLSIPPDHYFVMGDNRAESEDSRTYGPVGRDALLGFLEL